MHLREVFKLAIDNFAASMIIAHNHPSGDAESSDYDIAITKRLQEAGEMLEIEIIDHIIVARHEFLSLKIQDSALFKS